MAEKTDIKVYKEGRDMSRLGDYYILKKSKLSACYLKSEYTLIAEDFSYLNCNGDTFDIVIASSEHLAPLQLWAACNGLELLSSKPTTKMRRCILLD